MKRQPKPQLSSSGQRRTFDSFGSYRYRDEAEQEL